MIGVALIASGALCLYFSDAVAPMNSWGQNTLDAFGVGFVISGTVDVIIIWLSQSEDSGFTLTYRRAVGGHEDQVAEAPLDDPETSKPTD